MMFLATVGALFIAAVAIVTAMYLTGVISMLTFGIGIGDFDNYFIFEEMFSEVNDDQLP